MGCTARHRFPDNLDQTDRIRENFDIATLPEDAMREMRDGIATKSDSTACERRAWIIPQVR